MRSLTSHGPHFHSAIASALHPLSYALFFCVFVKVNRAARVEGHASGGQVLLSKAVCEDAGLTRTAVLQKHQLVLVDLGEYELKGIKLKERLFQLLPERLAHRNFASQPKVDKPHLPASFLDHGACSDSGSSMNGSFSTPQWWRVVSKGKVPVRESPDGDAFELGLLATGDQVEVRAWDES
jgi:hypothetical protein